MLGNNRDEALETAQNGTMNNHRAIHFVRVGSLVSSSVLEVETLGKLEVQLDGSALEGPFQCILDSDVDLGAVESTITRVELPLAWGMLVKSDF
jgi:hypothetical protein